MLQKQRELLLKVGHGLLAVRDGKQVRMEASILLNELTIWDSDYFYGCRMLQPGLQENFWACHPDEKHECHSEAESHSCAEKFHIMDS